MKTTLRTKMIKTTQITKITRREKEVLDLLSRGYSSSEISRTLWISEETVKSHRKNIAMKVGAKNAAHLIRRSFELGLFVQDKLDDLNPYKIIALHKTDVCQAVV